MHIAGIERLLHEEPHDKNLRKSIFILLRSVTDWPTEIANTEDFLRELGTCVEGELDEASIRTRLAGVNFATEAWIAESLDELVEIFRLYPKGTPLVQIMSSIENELRRRA
jgi:hypothetical protein